MKKFYIMTIAAFVAIALAIVAFVVGNYTESVAWAAASLSASAHGRMDFKEAADAKRSY